jgi:hypothetical protein
MNLVNATYIFNILAVTTIFIAICVHVMLFIMYEDTVSLLLTQPTEQTRTYVYRLCWIPIAFCIGAIIFSGTAIIIFILDKTTFNPRILISVLVLIIAFSYGLVLWLKYSPLIIELNKKFQNLTVLDTQYWRIKSFYVQSIVLSYVGIFGLILYLFVLIKKCCV